MRILITNDDGIDAPGLEVMHEIATALAGDGGEVWTVAPAFEQSGVGHCISFTHPLLISEISERRFAAQGSPADCVLAAFHKVMVDHLPNLVLSGVNRGNNSAENAMYSGTIGAAMEAALQGVPAIALSQYYGPRNVQLDDKFEAARAHGLNCVKAILDKAPWDDKGGYRMFYNVNFPPVPAADVRGMRAVRQGYRGDGRFGMKPADAPSGRSFMWITGANQQDPSGDDTDATANLEGYISVTPMRADLTANDALEAAKAIE
ncbi:MAG: 5'/3'-nucleotidase SurE [Pseudomonadota bacterium]